MRIGNAALLNTGAAATRPRMRASGNRKAAIQASSWASLTVSMAQPIIPGMLSNSRRM